MLRRVINCRLVTPVGIIPGNITTDKLGKISTIEKKSVKEGPLTVTRDTVDAGGRYVLPGLIETHGHFREPGFTHKEDINHGTKAALAGGFTTVFDMPNTKPPNTTIKRLNEQVERYRMNSHCDFAINFGAEVGDSYLKELESIDPKEVTGVKVFMAGHQTTPTTVTDHESQARIWELAAKKGLPILAHAEDQELVTSQEEQMKKTGRTDMLAYSEARNEEVVIKAARIAVDLAILYNTKLWILHASTQEEFNAIKSAREHGIEAGGEVTGYQLYFTTEDYERLGTKIKVSPALRTPVVNRRLWELVREGTIDGFCSEHTPHTLEEKDRDIWSAASGTPNIQESVPAFITGWIRQFGRNTLEEGLFRLASMSSTNVARFFGFPQKSGIAVGNDADFVILDTEDTWHVTKDDLFTKLKWSAYEGEKLIGRPCATILRGVLRYENGKHCGDDKGQWLLKSQIV